MTHAVHTSKEQPKLSFQGAFLYLPDCQRLGGACDTLVPYLKLSAAMAFGVPEADSVESTKGGPRSNNREYAFPFSVIETNKPTGHASATFPACTQ